MNSIREILDSCLVTLKSMRIDYNTPIGPKTNRLMNDAKLLITLIQEDYPKISQTIQEALNSLPIRNPIGTLFINAYAFGDLRTAIKILDNLYPQRKGYKRIFISHSSKDKDIVENFIDNILRLGLGFDTHDIFCTSIEDMAIRNGEDMREHIQANINNCDLAFLMISKSYKSSSICLNEMGAVWAYKKKIKTFVLPDATFDTIGWLYEVSKADRIDNALSLDALYDDLTNIYNIDKKTVEWGRQRDKFINTLCIASQ